MAFNINGLEYTSEIDGTHRLFTYTTSDNLSVIEGDGYYFGETDAALLLRFGDIIAVEANDKKALYRVTNSDAGTAGPSPHTAYVTAGKYVEVSVFNSDILSF